MDADGTLGFAGPVIDGGRFPTSRRRQSSSAPGSKILLKEDYMSWFESNDDTHSTPRIFTPCRWATFIHPGGGIVTR